MNTYLKSLFITFCILFLCSCSDTEEAGVAALPSGTLALQINGADRVSSQGAATATFTEVSSGPSTIYTFAIAGGFADFSGNNWSLITLLSSDQEIPVSEGQSWDQNSLNANTSFTVSYSENFDLTDDFFRAEYEPGASFSLSITSVDFINETISGEFSIEVKDSDNTTYQITNGRFNRIGFTRQ